MQLLSLFVFILYIFIEFSLGYGGCGFMGKCYLSVIYNPYAATKRTKQALFFLYVLNFVGKTIRHFFHKNIGRCRVDNFPRKRMIINKFNFLLSMEV